MLIKIVDDDQVFAKKIERMVYDGFKDIFLDYSIDCITSRLKIVILKKEIFSFWILI